MKRRVKFKIVVEEEILKRAPMYLRYFRPTAAIKPNQLKAVQRSIASERMAITSQFSRDCSPNFNNIVSVSEFS